MIALADMSSQGGCAAECQVLQRLPHVVTLGPAFGTRLHTAARADPKLATGRWALRRGQTVERADHLLHSRQGDVRVQSRGRDPLMAQQGLDRSDVGSRFQEMGGMTVAQSVGCDPRQSRVVASLPAGVLHPRGAHRLVVILAREHPLPRPRFTPVGTQFFQQLRGERYESFLLTLAQHPHDHATAIDLSGGEVQGFVDPHPGGVDGTQHNPVRPIMHAVEKEGHLLGRADRRQAFGPLTVGKPCDYDVFGISHTIKESDGGHILVIGRPCDLFFVEQVQEIAMELVVAELLWRLVEVAPQVRGRGGRKP